MTDIGVDPVGAIPCGCPCCRVIRVGVITVGAGLARIHREIQHGRLKTRPALCRVTDMGLNP